jgi:hypothetical protein
MPTHFRISLAPNEATAQVIAIVRRHTGMSISDIRLRILDGQPIIDDSPHHNEYSEFIGNLTHLLDELEANGKRYVVEMDGIRESPEYLRNTFQRWCDIGVESRMMADLESGEPCIDTLEWLKRESTPDVFFGTLRQIVDQDGFECDQKTIEWARKELSA